MKLSGVAFTLLAISLLLPWSAVGQEDACPPSSGEARQEVRSFLSDSEDADERQELGITVDPEQIRVLSGSGDSEVCRQLRNDFEGRTNQEPSFFEAGSYYFVVFRKVNKGSDGTVDTYPTPFIILNDDLSLVKIYI